MMGERTYHENTEKHGNDGYVPCITQDRLLCLYDKTFSIFYYLWNVSSLGYFPMYL